MHEPVGMKSTKVHASILTLAMAVPVFCLGSTVGCTSTGPVQAATAPSTDWTRYRTFGFDSTVLTPADRAVASRSAEARRDVEQTASPILERRGYVPARGERPDVLLRVTVGEPPSRGATEFQPPSQVQTENSDFYDTHEKGSSGTLVIDAFDTHTGQRIWQGSGETPFNPRTDREEMQRAVERTLSSFPAAGRRDPFGPNQ